MSEDTLLHIYLTNEASVKIDPRDWPQIAMASWQDNRPNQPNRKQEIRVRRHSDGRHIVYGRTASVFAGEPNRYGGYLVDADQAPDELVPTIEDLADQLGMRDELAVECIQDLPARVI